MGAARRPGMSREGRPAGRASRRWVGPDGSSRFVRSAAGVGERAPRGRAPARAPLLRRAPRPRAPPDPRRDRGGRQHRRERLHAPPPPPAAADGGPPPRALRDGRKARKRGENRGDLHLARVDPSAVRRLRLPPARRRSCAGRSCSPGERPHRPRRGHRPHGGPRESIIDEILAAALGRSGRGGILTGGPISRAIVRLRS